MARTREAPGWTSQFREIVMSVDADLHDLRALAEEPAPTLDPDSYAASRAIARHLIDRVGLRRSAIYQRMSEGRFPKCRSLGPKCSVWVEAEINAWIQSVTDRLS